MVIIDRIVVTLLIDGIVLLKGSFEQTYQCGESHEKNINVSFVDGFMMKQKVGHKTALQLEQNGKISLMTGLALIAAFQKLTSK
ncbi:hypothetical protein BJI55_18920 [Acinetobacter pittii]|nr:hypothetical protein BJI55_18920 [Acinetobacter pittii]